ncbi:MAG TPA: MFS transporter [Dermatophilaceae bacterium]|nr:MFS transporter [Dermatophilaceae bacterium]
MSHSSDSSRTPATESYRAVLAIPYAAPTFGAALVGRLSYGLLPLSVLFSVQQSTGSFATAGGVVAAIGLTSILLPLKARLVDRHGQAQTLTPLALLCASALAAIAVLAWSGPAPAAVYILLGVLAGLGTPPLGPAMRSTWRTLTDGTQLRQRAYSLDSVCEESLYLIGPLLVAVILNVASAPAALLVTASLMIVGTLAMVWMPPLRHVRSPESAAPLRFNLGPLLAPGFWPVVVAILVAAVGLSMAFTSIAARAQRQGLPAAAGYVEAAIALGSVAGGLLWGRRRHTRSHSTHLAGLIGVLGVGIALSAAATSLTALGIVMAVTGLAIAPLFVVSYLAADDLAPEHQQTEAGTWVNTANNIGSAAGASVAGLLIDRASISAGFAVGGVALALTSVLIWLTRRASARRRLTRFGQRAAPTG